MEWELVGRAQVGQVLREAPEVAVTCLGEEEGYLGGQEGADEEEDHVEEDPGAGLVGGLGEDQAVSPGEDQGAAVEAKAHATLVTLEVSGTEELRVEGREEGRWVGLGASVEGPEVVPEEEAQAWEAPVSELEAQPGHSAAAAAPGKLQ